MVVCISYSWLLCNCIPSLASKCEHMTPKHALIGCQTWYDWSSNIWSLADCNAKMFTQNFSLWKLKMFTINKYYYSRSKTTFVKGVCILTQVRVNFSEEVFNVQSLSCAEFSLREISSYGLLNFKCLITNHVTFDTQSEHASASRVHA